VDRLIARTAWINARTVLAPGTVDMYTDDCAVLDVQYDDCALECGSFSRSKTHLRPQIGFLEPTA